MEPKKQAFSYQSAKMSTGIITLDVSGEIFETTLGTLSKYPDSMLARMFAHSESGLPAMPKTKSDHYFLEVNPDSFRIRYSKLASAWR